MSKDPRHAEITVEGDDVIVTGSAPVADRRARLFFRSVVGATSTGDTWICPRRHHPVAEHIVRINAFLERNGYVVNRVGIADREVERELERRRSFDRTRSAARDFRAVGQVVNIDEAKQRLADFGWSPSRALRPHQEIGMSHALTAINAANFSVPGAGKTTTALAVAATHMAAGTIDVIVVVGPLAAFRPWEAETQLALGGVVRTKRVRGTVVERRAAYTTVRTRDLLLVSFGTAASDRLRLIELCRSFNVMLIVDESHRIKRFRGGLWAPALIDVARNARLRMVLSGTPMPQSGRDLFSQLNVLWPGGELTGSRDAFAARLDTNFRGVLADVQPFMSRTPKASLGLGPYQVHRHEVPLEPLQAEIYRLVLGGFRQRIENAATWSDKIDALRRARPIRMLQAASNPDLFNQADSSYRLSRVREANPTLMDRLAEYSSHEVPGKALAAVQLLRSIAADRGKTVCWSNFVHNLDQFSELVRSQLGIPCFQIDGRVPTGDDLQDDQAFSTRRNSDDGDTRERIIERFLNTDGPAVLVTNPASCSESISLHTTCHNAIYLDRTYDCAQFLQSIDRIHRLGLPPDVTVQVHILRATDDDLPTIDHLVDASIRGKEDAMLQLLEGAEVLPLEQSSNEIDDAEGDNRDLDALLRYLIGESQGQQA
ncbi:SNF2-related protein [Mycobacteroides abscessus]|uniref:SNF2-related protein n=1 Tax=Mycobacteroides abscessus TaxID=36809 RepID=UPI001E60C33E